MLLPMQPYMLSVHKLIQDVILDFLSPIILIKCDSYKAIDELIGIGR